MVAIVNIGNGASLPDGSYVNAQSLANTMSFSVATVQASSDINVLDDVNFSLGFLGTTSGNMFWLAPTINASHNVTMGNGALQLQASTVNLNGNIYGATGALLDSSKLSGMATTVNVQGNAADIQQAVYLTQYSSGLSTINVAAGTAAHGLSVNVDTSLLIHGGALSGTFALNNQYSSLSLFGHGFELDTGEGFAAIGSGDIGNLSGLLRGYLDSGDAFSLSFTQASANQIHLFSTSEVPIPNVSMLFALSLAGLMAKAVRRRRN